MDKINFANTAKLSFWDFVIDVSDLDAPKLVSGDYKDLRAKIESGELIDGVIAALHKGSNRDVVWYGRLHAWFLEEDQSLGTLIDLKFQNSPGNAPELTSTIAIKENNEVLMDNGTSPGEDHTEPMA